MAVRTKLALFMVTLVFVDINCESNTVRLNYEIDEAKTADLLRGSGEESEEYTKDIETKFKNIEPEKSMTDVVDYEERVTDGGLDADPSVDNVDNDKLTTVDDASTTISTSEAPEESDLKNIEDEYVAETSEDKKTEEAVTATIDTTEAESTISMIDNNVYKTRDNIEDSINNIDSASKTEPTTQSTTRPMDETDAAAPRVTGLDDELETVGQRNPKTENTESKQPIDKRDHEKHRPSPAVSKSTTLRRWLEDSWLRPPAGILVPLRPMALNRALAVWNDLMVGGLNVTDIVIVGYDSNGVTWRSRHNLQPSTSAHGDRAVSEALSKLILKYQDINNDDSSDGTMRALASAAKLVPYDSALFVVTDKGAGDPQRLPLALRALIEKRLKVYTIWTDPRHQTSESEAELQELRNISRHTEGDVLPYSLQVMEMDGTSNLATEEHREHWDSVGMVQGRQPRLNRRPEIDKLETLLVRRGGGEAISLGVPVDSGVTALRIYIEGAVEHAVLYPPNDAPQIDLYNSTSVNAFSPTSRSEGQTPRDVYLVFPGVDLDIDTLSVIPARPFIPESQSSMVGVWHLSVRCNTCDYRLLIAARAQLHFDIETDTPDMLKMRISGPVASIRDSLLVDEYGAELAKLPFSYQPMSTNNGDSVDVPISEVVAEVDLPTVRGSRVYAKIVGRDLRGDPFVRLAGPLSKSPERMGRSASIVFPESMNDLELAEEENSRIYNQKLRYNDSNILPYSRAISQVVNQRGTLLTAVQIGLSTRLYGAPGDNLQLHFEVTNYREQAVSFRFGAVGELRFLTGISPLAQTIQSGQTVNVIVSLTISNSAQPGARDLVTFTAYGQEQVSISTYVYVINSGDTTVDTWAPELRHNFQGTCLQRLGDDCAQHVWSATIIARDAVGGLLRLSSSPVGLTYDSNFIAGSREEVIAVYRATCCAPRVMVTAVDAFGNANSYIVDISNYYTPAAIAAIVLSVLLAIAIIALIVYLIHWCVKRRRESRELPSYATSSRNIS
ncbi:uncharacterized protein LOC113520912 [Galleria mellonella]|uniref:Uncharacterized protein LOC113520912 n=1 Tax=Galleria mellonella TaxID=7137 RepID=A0A6J1WYZ3_GALME|nr:uncharacterized protein LOC113520912 [Galleria mellonella]